jgi:hypothetical protein
MTDPLDRLKTALSDRYTIEREVGRLLLLTAIAGLACNDVEPAPQIEPFYRLLTEEVWGGGDIVLVSPAVPTVHEPIRAVIGEDTVSATYRRGDTVVFRAPSLSGTYGVQLLPPIVPAPGSTDAVRVYGFTDYAEGPMVSGWLLPMPTNSPVPQVLAYGPDALLLVDLRWPTAHRLVEYSALGLTIHPQRCHGGPGLSYRQGFAVICSALWQLMPQVQADSRTLVFGPGNHNVVEIDRECEAAAHGGLRFSCLTPGGRVYRSYQEGDPWISAWRLSPSGQLVTFDGQYPTGCPVYDRTGDRLYAVGPALDWVFCSMAFSPSGDTLFAAWSDGGYPWHLHTVNAANGALLATLDFPESVWVDRVVADPVRPWLYVSTRYGAWASWDNAVPRLFVLDRRTMEVVGTVSAPERDRRPLQDEVIVVVGTEAVYLAPHWGWPGSYENWEYRLGRWRFEVLPLED